MEEDAEDCVKNILLGLPSCSSRNEDDAIDLKLPSTDNREFVPLLRSNVCYIVAAVIFNEKDEVLMVQEAKPSCRGLWYLPAGRMEPGETIVEAVRREVFEESGLELEAETLLYVETAAGSWYRFVLTGRIVGGTLKTEPDEESLRADWVGDLDSVRLRGNDILPLIQRGRLFSRPDAVFHPNVLPLSTSHRKLCLRLVVVARSFLSTGVSVLASSLPFFHLPRCEIGLHRSIHSTLKSFVSFIFKDGVPDHRPHGLLGVEHSGRSAEHCDGICLSLLVSVRAPVEEVQVGSPFAWHELSHETAEKILDRMPKNMTLPINVIRSTRESAA